MAADGSSEAVTTAGSGGMGSLPSSRLTKILQEKAEALKKRRQGAEAAAAAANERLEQLVAADIQLPEAEAREASLKELVRHSDWDGVETGAKSFLAYLERDGAPKLETRRDQLGERIRQLADFGFPVQEEVPPLLVESKSLQDQSKWKESIDRLLAVLEGVRSAESRYVEHLSAELHRLAEWAGESPDHVAIATAQAKPFLEAIRTGTAGNPLAEFTATLERELPGVTTRRTRARETATSLGAVAAELGVPSKDLLAAVEVDRTAPLLTVIETVRALDAASQKVAAAVRDRVVQTLESYRATLTALREYGVEPELPLARLEGTMGQVAGAPPSDLPHILTEARRIVDEPVVAVVAGLLDEARPKLVEARRLGRNSSEVFASMNRAREALRLKIYGEALAASQEALDQVARLTEDLDAARSESEALGEILRRLATTQFPVGSYTQPVAEIRDLLDRVELLSAQQLLKQTVQRLGAEAVEYFQNELTDLDRLGRIGGELGFTPSEYGGHLARTRKLLEDGSVAEAAEACSRLEVELRTAAVPYLARRLDEIGKSLEEIPEASLTDPVRRLLADADVGLRVKEDLKGSLDTLRRAEREFSVVFAQHASSLVEGLEEERRVLESMGGTGDEMQRQIDEVQQIFNMGDFVKAFRAAQDIRTRAQQQQLVRSEESLSHAKLALVELGKLGLDTIELKAELDRAQESAQDGQYPAAYRAAQKVLEAAARTRTTAQSTLDRIREVNELWESLGQSGVAVQPFAEPIAQARAACQALEFDRARQLAASVHEQLDLELARYEAGRLVEECDALLEDGQRLSVPVESYRTRIDEVKRALPSTAGRQFWGQAREVRDELVALLRPVYEENIRSLERDVEIARGDELDVAGTVELLTEARRRLGLPVPVGLAEVLDTARARFFETKGFVEHAERATRRAQEELNRAELVRVDVRPFRVRLERIERHLSERDYARAIEMASALERELTQATHQQVSKTLASFQGMIVRAHREGAATALAENLLGQARNALEGGAPVEALQFAARSEAELERIELQVLVAQGSLESIRHRIDAATRTGLHAPEAHAHLEAAQGAFDRHEFDKVLELSLAATDALAHAGELERRARDAFEAAERQVAEAGEMSADLAEVLPVLERAREELRSGAYDAAVITARESSEAARWSIERLYAGPFTALQELIELVRSTASDADATAVRAARDEAEAALKVREWRRTSEALTHGNELAHAALEQAIEGARRNLDGLYAVVPEAPTADEAEVRVSSARRVAAERQQRNYLAALEALREEESRAREQVRRDLAGRVAQLQDRLWVGEKLGVDTTPAMEVFSEAKIAMEAGRLEPVAALIQRGATSLEILVRQRIEEKLRDVETELVFARDGLHVTLGGIPERLESARQRLKAGAPVEAAKSVLESEEELNRRKALHRELMNLHFLVDAALSRATERRLDTSVARQLLEESLRLRAQDYGPSLEKAREALRTLQEALRRVDPSAAGTGMAPRLSEEST
ncbi:MAG TPA: hypothetical protein VGV89_04080 [Thermoplasmata archaeon]|nr:hypothetical protein [Thermoplasmata archaeon]